MNSFGLHCGVIDFVWSHGFMNCCYTCSGILWVVFHIMDLSRSYICVVASGQLHMFKTNALHVSFFKLIYDGFIDNHPLMIYVCLYKLPRIPTVCKRLLQTF